MISHLSSLAVSSVCIFAIVSVHAQPYHTDSIVGGIQTTEVQGDLSIKQYGSGSGGDLRVVGEARLAEGAAILPGMPVGVTGVCYGPVKIGNGSNIVEYKFSKLGDDESGDFIVPLGRFGDWEGALLEVDALTGPADWDSGAAHFKLMGKRHRGNGKLTAMEHSAFGGGRGVKLHGWNFHGVTFLFLEFDGTSAYNGVQDHSIVVRIKTIGSCEPFNRETTLADMVPVEIATSLRSDAIFGDDLTQTFNAGNILLNGDVAIPFGKTIKINGSPVLTESSAPLTSTAWTNAFVPRGNVLNGGFLAFNGTASGTGSIAIGPFSSASGAYSFTMGGLSTASGHASWAGGFGALASGHYSTSRGLGTTSNSYSETVFGRSNIVDDNASSTEWVELNGLFRLGNGSSGNPSDAMTVLKNGQTTLINRAWKADYANSVSNALKDPASATDSGGTALVVEGHAILKGKVILEAPQGDISMGMYE